MTIRPASDPLVGRVIAEKYAIESLIGSGAMGSVYAARHKTLDTIVAVKVLHSALATDAAFAERFHREAKSVSRLHHPNVIQVVDFGREPDGLFYIVMEYVDGVDLFQILQREWPLNDRRAGEIVCQILSGIAAAHDMGIVHRDIKPENIIVTRGLDDEGRARELVKVCDFGIAKVEEPEPVASNEGVQRTLTTRGLLLGTPQYMSPEQCRGEALDARTDVYSVGIILYQLLAGRLPFQAPATVDVVIKQVTEEPILPTRIYPHASPALEAVCLRALRKRTEERYATARDMRAEVRQALDSRLAFSLDSSVPPPAGTRGTLPSQPPHAFTAPALGDESPTKASPLSPPSRGRLRNVRVYVAAAVLVFGVGASIAWFHAKPVATRPPIPPVSATTVAVLPGTATSVEPIEAAPGSAAIAAPPAPAAHGSRKSKTDHAATATRAVEDTPPASVLTESVPVPPAKPVPEPAVTEVAVPAGRTPLAPQPTPGVTSLNPDSGQVSWKVSAVGGGATAGGVMRALSRASSSWSGCYRSGLRSRGRRIEGTALLRLSCDEQGRVIRVEVSGLDMPDVLTCIRGTTSGVTIPNADTGEAWATVALSFRVRD